ncbi:MAG: AsnC family protein [Syntrophomonadaceae bacterium]|nr:AsnC family protein [Syntrophomonadaceae bacterium]
MENQKTELFEVSPGEVSVTFFIDNALAVKDTVNDTQSRILNLLAIDPRMTAKAISAKLGINERNATN